MKKPRRAPNATPVSTSAIRSSTPHTRAPLERIWHIHGRLGSGKPLTTVSLAADLDVCIRTIKRDIDMMRDRLGLPVEWNSRTRTYFYARPCETLPLLRVDAEEALALALAGRLFASLRGSPFGRLLEAVFKKLAPALGGAVSVAYDSVEETLFTSSEPFDQDVAHLLPLVEAIRGRIHVQIDYVKAGATRPQRRIVHPLHVAELDRQLVLVAEAGNKPGIRHFVLSRIRSVKTLETHFEWPSGFDVHRYLRGCLGRFAGDQEHVVRFALDEHAAFYAREKAWHSSQTLSQLPDGRVELTLRLNHLADARIAALRWADHVEVLAPAELRDQVISAIDVARTRYSAARTASGS